MRVRDCFKLFPCFDGRNGERQLGCLNADLHVWKGEQLQEQTALIAFPPLQLVGDIHHLPEQAIEFCNLAAKKRSILGYYDLRKTFHQILRIHGAELSPFHGFNTLNLTSASQWPQ
jgi:hypothetical protein